MAELDVECPRCGKVETGEIEELEDGSLEIECTVCHATLIAAYSVSVDVEVDGVEIELPAAEFACVGCGCEISLEEISDKTGSEQVRCPDCGAPLDVQWSDWGTAVRVEVADVAEMTEDDNGWVTDDERE